MLNAIELISMVDLKCILTLCRFTFSWSRYAHTMHCLQLTRKWKCLIFKVIFKWKILFHSYENRKKSRLLIHLKSVLCMQSLKFCNKTFFVSNETKELTHCSFLVFSGIFFQFYVVPTSYILDSWKIYCNFIFFLCVIIFCFPYFDSWQEKRKSVQSITCSYIYK